MVGLFRLYLSSNDHGGLQCRKEKGSPKRSLAPFRVLLVAMTLGGIVYRGVSVTLPAYFELQNRDLYQGLLVFSGQIGSPNLFATLVTSVIYLVGMLGQYAGGRVGESYDLGRGYLIFHLITIPAALAMAFTTDTLLILFAMIHSFFLLGMQPLENTLVARLSPPKVHSSAFGLKFILTFGVGALSVKMVALVKADFGFSAVYISLACVSTLLVCTILVLNSIRKISSAS